MLGRRGQGDGHLNSSHQPPVPGSYPASSPRLITHFPALATLLSIVRSSLALPNSGSVKSHGWPHPRYVALRLEMSTKHRGSFHYIRRSTFSLKSAHKSFQYDEISLTPLLLPLPRGKPKAIKIRPNIKVALSTPATVAAVKSE